MKSIIFAAGLLLTASSAWSQQPDPARAFEAEWGTIIASDTLSAAAHKHTADLAQKLLVDYRKKVEDLKTAQDELAAYEARLVTSMEWLKQAQDARPCADPVK